MTPGKTAQNKSGMRQSLRIKKVNSKVSAANSKKETLLKVIGLRGVRNIILRLKVDKGELLIRDRLKISAIFAKKRDILRRTASLV